MYFLGGKRAEKEASNPLCVCRRNAFHEIIINLQTFIFSQYEMTTSFPKAQITSVNLNDKSEKNEISPKKTAPFYISAIYLLQ
jgi:hypothetical protein